MPAGYTSGQVSVLDTITREYKNASNITIAIQKIIVSTFPLFTVNSAGMSLVTTASQSTSRFKRTAKIQVETEKVFITGGSRVVSTVTTTGNFNEFTQEATDIGSVTYTSEGLSNDIIVPVSLLGGIFQVGDTV